MRKDTAWLTFDALLVLVVVLLGTALATGLRIRVISGASMGPGLRDGSVALVQMPTVAPPARGDIVLFRWTPEADLQLKRVVAIAGDEVAMHEAQLYVNNRRALEPYASTAAPSQLPLPKESHVQFLVAGPAEYRPTDRRWGPLIIPDSAVWTLGDNRSSSVDSRHRGPVDLGLLEGRVIASITLRRY